MEPHSTPNDRTTTVNEQFQNSQDEKSSLPLKKIFRVRKERSGWILEKMSKEIHPGFSESIIVEGDGEK